VAGFIGSPPMNLIDARLERSPDGRGGPRVMFGRHGLEIPAQVMADRPALEGYLGRDVVVGIRPEHLLDAGLLRETDPASVVELPVRLREELGAEVYIHCGIGSAAHHSEAAQDVTSLATLVARMDGQTALAEGQPARIQVETSELHFFDPGTGQAIRG
jgi:multiple sugar transport system ATP-binding protein